MTKDVSHRRGPHPLAMHIGMSGAYLQDNEGKYDALISMIQGMQKYQSSTYYPQKLNRETIWEEGQASLLRLLDIKINQSEAPLCVFVPSLINSHEIFDLCPERSMGGWFLGAGFESYIFNWGDLKKEQHNIDVNILITERLKPALETLKTKNPDRPIHVLGYCMGGTLCLGLAHAAPDLMNSLTLLASPWNYHCGTQTLLKRIQFWAPSALMQAERKKVLSANSLQMLFASVDPLLAQRKFTKFLKMEEGSEASNLFIVVEDWLNSGGDIPEKIAQECIVGWYLKNDQYMQNWIVDGNTVKAENIICPVFIVASEKDRLVDYESSISLLSKLKKCDHHDPDCGHIGMIAGHNSIDKVWAPISNWMRKQTS